MVVALLASQLSRGTPRHWCGNDSEKLREMYLHYLMTIVRLVEYDSDVAITRCSFIQEIGCGGQSISSFVSCVLCLAASRPLLRPSL